MRRLFYLMLACLLIYFAGCRVEYGIEANNSNESDKTISNSSVEFQNNASNNSIPSEQQYIEVTREGFTEKIPVETVKGTVGDYTIANDPELFDYHPTETVDLFEYKYDFDGGDVYFAISDYYGTDRQEFVYSTVEQFGKEYESYSVAETKIAGYNAVKVCFNNDKTNRDFQKEIIMVDCGEQQYLFETSFLFEMYEGAYVIMTELFDTFKILE